MPMKLHVGHNNYIRNPLLQHRVHHLDDILLRHFFLPGVAFGKLHDGKPFERGQHTRRGHRRQLNSRPRWPIALNVIYVLQS